MRMRILAPTLVLLVLSSCRRSEPIVTQTAPAQGGGPAAKPEPKPELAADAPVGTLEVVATFDGAMPTGVAVSRRGRVFVNFPKWGDKVDFTVAELKNGKPAPYPDQAINDSTLVSVQSVVVDPRDRLWMLDTGSIELAPPAAGGPKLVAVDLEKNAIARTILFTPDVALPTTYLNDVRFDLRRGKEGYAFITDSSRKPGSNAIIVVDLATGKARRRLHGHPSVTAEPMFLPLVEGKVVETRKPGEAPQPISMGSDGIAISGDGKTLYYCALAGRKLFSVSVDALVDDGMTDDAVAATVKDLGFKPASDGLEADDQSRVYLTAYEHDAILRKNLDGSLETLVHDPRLLWPDTLSLASDGYLYVTANQLHRQPSYQGGKDLRAKPYVLFRTKVDGKPVIAR
jgi:sugar lactone lactonase YvrE